MGPKAKAKGKKKGKTKRGEADGDKKQGEQLTFKEAVLDCRIKAIEKQIDHILVEKEKVFRRNERQRERNKLLKEEQLALVDNTVSQAKELESALSSQEVVTKEEVESAFKECLAEEKAQEDDLNEIESQIQLLEEEREKVVLKIEELVEYKTNGQFVHATQIKLMKEEMDDLDHEYNDMTESVTNNLEVAKETTRKMVASSISKQKKAASESAMDSLSHESHQEFMDNKWLLREVNMHEQQMKESQRVVDELEAANLEIISRLLERRLSNADVSSFIPGKPLALTDAASQSQAEEAEGLDVVEWQPRLKSDEDLDNYLIDPYENCEDGSTVAGDLASLHIKGHAMTIGIKPEEEMDVSDSPSFSLWTNAAMSAEQLPAKLS